MGYAEESKNILVDIMKFFSTTPTAILAKSNMAFEKWISVTFSVMEKWSVITDLLRDDASSTEDYQ